MADAMDTLKSILGDDAEDKIKSVMSSISAPNDALPPQINTDGLEGLMQIKSIMDNMTSGRNDPRSNLLRSLKPYMRGRRQQSIDSAIKLLGLSSLTKLFKR